MMMSSKILYRSISSEKSISCDINALWKVVSMPSNLDLFHPFCKKNPTIAWEENRHEDEIHYIRGFILKRKFVAWEKNTGYDLVI